MSSLELFGVWPAARGRRGRKEDQPLTSHLTQMSAPETGHQNRQLLSREEMSLQQCSQKMDAGSSGSSTEHTSQAGHRVLFLVSHKLSPTPESFCQTLGTHETVPSNRHQDTYTDSSRPLNLHSKDQ